MVKSSQRGGKGVTLTPDLINSVTSSQNNLSSNASTSFDGCTPATCADVRLGLNESQTKLNLSGGSVNSVEVDCPTVVGQNSSQQASSCGLFKTGAELSLFNESIVGGNGKRKKRRTGKKRRTDKKRKTGKKRNKTRKR